MSFRRPQIIQISGFSPINILQRIPNYPNLGIFPHFWAAFPAPCSPLFQRQRIGTVKPHWGFFFGEEIPNFPWIAEEEGPCIPDIPRRGSSLSSASQKKNKSGIKEQTSKGAKIPPGFPSDPSLENSSPGASGVFQGWEKFLEWNSQWSSQGPSQFPTPDPSSQFLIPIPDPQFPIPDPNSWPSSQCHSQFLPHPSPFPNSLSSPTVGKPYKCSSCGRSYKQQSSLEEHRERCHSFLRSLPAENPTHAGQREEIRELDMVPEALLHPERPTFIERLAGSFTKRKRSTPQKFVGEKQMRFALSELPFDVSPGFDKDVEVVPARAHPLDAPYAGPLSLLGAGDPLRPLRLATNCITEVTPVISSVYTQIQALPARLELPRGRGDSSSAEDGAEGIPVIFRGGGGRDHRESAAGSPSNGCQDSTDTESIQEERAGGGSSRHSPAYAKEEPKEEPEGAARCFPKESLRVLNEDGEQLRAFCCEHCRVLFLDHVMFTIHMGCHGFRDPFECNICGYRTQDRYEFSSHIVLGEHKI
uniref:IKAROS family zinc finger 4 n=1 Tax=Cyanoderma ruficeps TaxID=181631 RepID=A0A8C3QU31_9PASS